MCSVPSKENQKNKNLDVQVSPHQGHIPGSFIYYGRKMWQMWHDNHLTWISAIFISIKHFQHLFWLPAHEIGSSIAVKISYHYFGILRFTERQILFPVVIWWDENFDCAFIDVVTQKTVFISGGEFSGVQTKNEWNVERL